jgi:hypothetical protein
MSKNDFCDFSCCSQAEMANIHIFSMEIELFSIHVMPFYFLFLFALDGD